MATRNVLSSTALENVILKGKNRLKASFTGTLTCGSAQVEYDLGDLTSAGWHLTPPHDSQPKTHNANGQPGKATGISFFI